MKVSATRWAGAAFAVVVTSSACQPMESGAHEEQHAELARTAVTRNGPQVAALTISHGTAFSRAKVYQLTSASPTVTPGADVVLSQQNALRYTMPAMSVSTLVLEP